MWVLFQRVVAALLSFLIVDAFPNCHSVVEVWQTFRAMRTVEQIGIVAIVFVVLFVVGETLNQVARVTWRTVTYVSRVFNLWLTTRKISSLSTVVKPPLLPPAE
jgi:hypothetical protein